MAEIEPVDVRFLLVHAVDLNSVDFLRNTLRDALEAGYDEVSDDALDYAADLNYQWPAGPGRTLSGLTLHLGGPIGTARATVKEVVEALAQACRDNGSDIYHALKFDDPVLYHDLQAYTRDLFALEMELREALSVTLLAMGPSDEFDLLREVKASAMKLPGRVKLRDWLQNELFYLDFTGYKRLNEPAKSGLPLFQDALTRAATFEEFRAIVQDAPIQGDPFEGFVASLGEILSRIDQVRNCVAHNRAVPDAERDNYQTSKPLADDAVKRFLAEIAQGPPDNEPVSEPENAPPTPSPSVEPVATPMNPEPSALDTPTLLAAIANEHCSPSVDSGALSASL